MLHEPNLGWGLPPGVTDRDIDGPEERDEYDRTKTQRDAEENEEHKGDMERDGDL